MLGNTLRLNFCYLKIIDILHARYHPKIIRHILKNKQKNKCVCFYQNIRLVIMKMEMEMKNRSHRYDINRHRSSHECKYSKYKKCLSVIMMIMWHTLRNSKATFEAQFIKKLSNTDAELKKSVAYKKKCVPFFWAGLSSLVSTTFILPLICYPNILK